MDYLDFHYNLDNKVKMKTFNDRLPKITIVTPSFNQGLFLHETIDSILNQGYSNLEYFIVDGGSTDNSVNIIREYEDRIDWWVSEKDNGQTEAINKGFERATGELLCWVNSDDILLPGCLHLIAKNYLSQNQPDIIHGNVVYTDSSGKITKMIRVPKQTHFFAKKGMWSTPQPAVFYRADLVKRIGYLDPQYHLSMDVDLWMKMTEIGAKIGYIPEYLGAFRWHETSKTTISIQARKHRYAENPEAKKIYDAALPKVSQRKRNIWRNIWRLYQAINLNYLRSYMDTIYFQGKHWQEIFSN
jgi:glycosyltransferase involved in cell wall biosynthesis